jgi:hypothetical protein
MSQVTNAEPAATDSGSHFSHAREWFSLDAMGAE